MSGQIKIYRASEIWAAVNKNSACACEELVSVSDHERIVAEKVREAVDAERKRIREQEVEPLMDAVEDCLSAAKAEWASVNNHPASRHGKDVRYYEGILAAVRTAQEKEVKS